MNRYCFYLHWQPPDPPFWWNQDQEPEDQVCNLYVHCFSFEQAFNIVQSIPGTIKKILPSRGLNDFTEAELLDQHYYNVNCFL